MIKLIILCALLSAVACQVYRGLPIDDHAMNFLVRVQAKYLEEGGHVNVSVGGGIIVSPRMILTAATNVVIIENFSKLPFEVEVVAGTKLLGGTPVSGTQTHTVFNERVHLFPRSRNFVTSSFDQRYNVALIVLAKPLRLGPMVQVANMGQPPISNQHQCWVMGWGETSRLVHQNGQMVDQIEPLPRRAMIGRVRMLDPTRCETTGNNYFATIFHRSHHECYGCAQGDHCQQPGDGDSGGPVVCRHHGREYVVAVHSFSCKLPGVEVCTPGNPSAGVRIGRGMRE